MKTGRLRLVARCVVQGVVFCAVCPCGVPGSRGRRVNDPPVLCRGRASMHLYNRQLQDRSQGRPLSQMEDNGDSLAFETSSQHAFPKLSSDDAL